MSFIKFVGIGTLVAAASTALAAHNDALLQLVAIAGLAFGIFHVVSRSGDFDSARPNGR